MKTKAIAIDNACKDDVRISTLMKEGLEELAAIRKENRALDAEIRRLGAATRKKLGRIRDNLRHVQATR